MQACKKSNITLLTIIKQSVSISYLWSQGLDKNACGFKIIKDNTILGKVRKNPSVYFIEGTLALL